MTDTILRHVEGSKVYHRKGCYHLRKASYDRIITIRDVDTWAFLLRPCRDCISEP